MMSPDAVLSYCLNRFAGTVPVESWGERGVFAIRTDDCIQPIQAYTGWAGYAC